MINLDKLQLYKAEKEGHIYYGSVLWKSIFRARMYKEGKGTLYRQQQIINFKNRNINSKYFLKVVRIIEEYFETDFTIALPGSGIELTSLQKLLNNTYITRKQEVAQMKYRENRKIDSNEINTLEIKWSSIKGSKILLVDDLITTGNTMNFYKNILKEKLGKKEFICYGFGINAKLEPVLIKELEFQNQKEQEINIDELLNGIRIVI